MESYKSPYEEAARKRARLTRKFISDVIAFIMVNAFLFVINMVTSPDVPWFLFCLFGWGIPLVVKGVKLFGPLNDEWEESKVREIIQKMERKEQRLLKQAPANHEHLNLQQDSLEEETIPIENTLLDDDELV